MLPFLLMFLSMFQSAISPGRGTGAVASSSAPALTYSDNFAGTGALSANWTVVTASGYTSLARVSGKAQSSPSGTKGLAIYTGGTFSGDQIGQAAYGVTGDGGASGPGVRLDSSGNGYVWVVNAHTIYKLIGGAGASVVTSSCPGTGIDGMTRLSVVGSTLTCAIIVDGLPTGAVSATDSTYTTGYPGILVDDSTDATNYLANWSGQ